MALSGDQNLDSDGQVVLSNPAFIHVFINCLPFARHSVRP